MFDVSLIAPCKSSTELLSLLNVPLLRSRSWETLKVAFESESVVTGFLTGKVKGGFTVSLDENHVPEKIQWAATDTGEEEIKDAKAMIISLWDAKENNTLRIDLWTKDMMLDEMKHFFYQSIITMSDTYERATNDKAIAEEMREFGKMIGEKMLDGNKN